MLGILEGGKFISNEENNKYKFIFETDDGKEIECELVFSFYLKKEDKQYWLITDNTYDEEGNLKIYAYFNTSTDQNLTAVTDKKEFEGIDKVYKYLIEKMGEK